MLENRPFCCDLARALDALRIAVEKEAARPKGENRAASSTGTGVTGRWEVIKGGKGE